MGALALAAFLGAAGWFAVRVVERIRVRIRLARRVRPFAQVADTDVEPETAATVVEREVETREGALTGILDARYPLAGGRRTATIALCTGAALAVALVPALAFVGVPAGVAVLLALGLGALAARTLARVREQRVGAKYRERLLVVLEDFERMTRFGIGAGQAFNSVTGAAEDPVQASLRRVTLDVDFGVPIAVALGREAQRIRISELAMLAAILSTQSRTGGSLHESVGNVARMLRERLDARERVKAETAESKISLIILALVPLAGLTLLAFSQPEIIATLLSEGRFLLGIGFGLVTAGMIVAWMIVRSAQS